MDIQKVQSLINKEEGPKLDFKLQLNIDTGSGKKELAKDVSAIANSRGGRGYIIFGVEDKTKRIVGINPGDFEEEKIQQIISTRCDPPIPISVDTIMHNGKYLAVITIYSGEQRPYQMRETGTFYIRRGSTTDIMRKEELVSSIQDAGLVNYELTPVLRAKVDSLNMDSIRKYSEKIGVPFDDMEPGILENLGIIIKDKDMEEYHPTAGGLLLFGYNPQIYLPHCYIRVLNNINPKYDQVKNFAGPIIDMIDNTEEFIKDVIQSDMYPISAINEALANAVAYRDYFDIYNEISVFLFKKSIEVRSPGGLIRREPGTHSTGMGGRRNMWLYQRLITMDDRGRFLQTGRGFKRMQKAFRGRGKVKFINMEDNNLFKVIFPGVDSFR